MVATIMGYGYCLGYLLALFSWPARGVAYPANSYRDLDICNHWNGRRHFLELGERGELHARNVSTTAFRVSPCGFSRGFVMATSPPHSLGRALSWD